MEKAVESEAAARSNTVVADLPINHGGLALGEPVPTTAEDAESAETDRRSGSGRSRLSLGVFRLHELQRPLMSCSRRS